MIGNVKEITSEFVIVILDDGTEEKISITTLIKVDLCDLKVGSRVRFSNGHFFNEDNVKKDSY